MWLTELRSLTFNLANDLFNGHVRSIETAHGTLALQGLGNAMQWIHTNSHWLRLPEGLTIASCNPRDEFTIRIPSTRNAQWDSLLYAQICVPCWRGLRRVRQGEGLEDWAVLLSTAGSDPLPNAQGLHSPADLWRSWIVTAAGVRFWWLRIQRTQRPRRSCASRATCGAL